MYVCTYVYMYTYIYIYIYIYLFIYLFMYVCMILCVILCVHCLRSWVMGRLLPSFLLLFVLIFFCRGTEEVCPPKRPPPPHTPDKRTCFCSLMDTHIIPSLPHLVLHHSRCLMQRGRNLTPTQIISLSFVCRSLSLVYLVPDLSISSSFSASASSTSFRFMVASYECNRI